MHKLSLKVEFKGVLVFSVFYVAAGILLLPAAVLFTIPHLGILGVLSLICSYGLIKMKKWSIFLTTVLSVSGVVFGAAMVYLSIQLLNSGIGLPLEPILFYLMLSVYMVFLLASFVYVMIRKEKFS